MDTGYHDLTAAYALDALDADERAAYESHLAECEACRAELASFGDVATALAVGAVGPAPRPGLREEILRAAREEGHAVVPIEVAAERRRRNWTPVLGAVAAVAAVVAVAVGIWAGGISDELDSTREALERERQAAAVLADPTARSVAVSGAEGRLVVTDAGRAVLVLDGLDDAPSGKTYEVWVIEGDTPAPAGLFPVPSHRRRFPSTSPCPTVRWWRSRWRARVASTRRRRHRSSPPSPCSHRHGVDTEARRSRPYTRSHGSPRPTA